METIGKRLQYFLEKEGVDIKTFSEQIELHQNSVYRMMNEDRGMNSITLVKIMKAYPQININWLLTGNGNYETAFPTELKLQEKTPTYYTKSDDELKTKVRAILNNEVVLDTFIEILKKYDR